MKRIVFASLLIMMPLLTACNTMSGLGEDVQKGGQKLETTAEDNKNY